MGFEDDIAILAATPVFGFFEQGALRLLTFAGERINLAAGDMLFRRGDRADGGYVVLSGTISLTRARSALAKNERAESELPKDATTVTAGRSALIGRNTLFAPGLRQADAQAAETSEVMRISAQLMTRVLREFPDAAAAIHEWLAEDLRDLTRGLGQVRAKLIGDSAS